MSKSLRPIIITGSVIVLLVIAMVLMVYVFPTGVEEEPEAEETVPSTEIHKIIDEPDSELLCYEIIPAEGDTMRVEINRQEDGSISYNVIPATEYFEYDTSKFRSMIYTLTSISATDLVEEDAGDLAIYGLDRPWLTARSYYTGNRVVDLYIGNPTPTDNNYYVTTNETDTVYTIGNYVVSLLSRKDIDYRKITLFPLYSEEEVYDKINYVKMTLRDGTVIEINHEDLDNLSEGNVTGSAYFMTSPVRSSCNDTLVKEKIIDVVSKLTSSEVLMDITPEQYQEYGFDNPAKLEMTDTAGNAVSILVGKKRDDSSYYVMLEQSPETVIACYADAFTWLDINYIELMNRVVWIEKIVDIESVVYNLDGKSYVVEITHGKTVGEDGKEKATLSATLNGEEISETNCRRLYTRTLNFRIIGNVQDTGNLGDAQYKITLNKLDGTSRTMELIKLNERQYAVRLDGEVNYYVYKKNVTTLLEAFETVLSGKELPMSYDA
ncbi:MAG: DUF4340 domain-containing protein [Oscillospiraceae bacterium]